MAPARNLLRRHHDNFASFFDQAGLDQLYERSILMAEKAAESSARNAQEEEEEEKEEEVAEASSKLHASGSYQSWLQLGTGTSQIAMAPQDPAAGTTRGRGGVVELDLFPGRPPVDPLQPRLPPQPMMVLGGYGGQLRGFWRSPSPSSSSLAVAPLHPVMPSGSGQFMQTQATTSSSDIRVVSPPPRPQTGLWVMLKPAENQIKEPFLTEIPKSYLRIKY
ncbi:hypothetical protein Cni_G03169 [Canna indica]|uniref:Uncharacterized protein n=1 Tax=Canna indica TaxID=4628 RepID=A0AAQ3JR63_9LILI|nr:hypothetical protein Cni_G03169 [Canna indica]